MTPLWGAIKDKYYADKPETIDALKDNIHKEIGEIQLHTIDTRKYSVVFLKHFPKKDIWRTLYMSGRAYILKWIPNDRSLRSFLMIILFPLRVFAKRLLKGSRRKNIFFIFRFVRDV